MVIKSMGGSANGGTLAILGLPLNSPLLLIAPPAAGDPVAAAAANEDAIVGVWTRLLLWPLLLLLWRAASPVPMPLAMPPPLPPKPNPLIALPTTEDVGVDVEFKSNFGYRTAVGFTGCKGR